MTRCTRQKTNEQDRNAGSNTLVFIWWDGEKQDSNEPHRNQLLLGKRKRTKRKQKKRKGKERKGKESASHSRCSILEVECNMLLLPEAPSSSSKQSRKAMLPRALSLSYVRGTGGHGKTTCNNEKSMGLRVTSHQPEQCTQKWNDTQPVLSAASGKQQLWVLPCYFGMTGYVGFVKA